MVLGLLVSKFADLFVNYMRIVLYQYFSRISRVPMKVRPRYAIILTKPNYARLLRTSDHLELLIRVHVTVFFFVIHLFVLQKVLTHQEKNREKEPPPTSFTNTGPPAVLRETYRDRQKKLKLAVLP